MTRIFGTDGIRGPFNGPLINAANFFKLGLALKSLVPHQPAEVLIARDTRASGPELAEALSAGLQRVGISVRDCGVLPTPVLAWLVPHWRAHMGLVISASHNPYSDNGLKFFKAQGTKLSDFEEDKLTEAWSQLGDSAEPGLANTSPGNCEARALEAYQNYISAQFKPFKRALHVVLDCAEGACYRLAPQLLRALNLQVTCLDSGPDGRNINNHCGANHPARLQTTVLALGADCGIAFDGDGDRLLMVDKFGEVLDGDALLYILALDQQQQGCLKGGVVGTVMSNLGLEQALSKHAITFKRVPVGDRHISQALEGLSWNLGGESSGHLINCDLNPTGDGLLSAVQILAIMEHTAKSLTELCQGLDKLPQILLNVANPKGPAVLEHPALVAGVRQVTQDLSNRGRVLLRASGTEPVIRILLEGHNFDELSHHTQNLAKLLAELQH